MDWSVAVIFHKYRYRKHCNTKIGNTFPTKLPRRFLHTLTTLS